MTPEHNVRTEVLAERLARVQDQVGSNKIIMDERDRLYDTRFRAAEIAVSAALAAQEKSTATAFLASEKAVLKAEDAQKDYNQRSNEFRGQLDDQAKTLMPRLEAQAAFKSMEEKLEGLKITAQTDIERLRVDIQSLRESRSEGAGKGTGTTATWAIIATLFLALMSVAGLVITVWKLSSLK
jgi:hypothetical protein